MSSYIRSSLAQDEPPVAALPNTTEPRRKKKNSIRKTENQKEKKITMKNSNHLFISINPSPSNSNPNLMELKNKIKEEKQTRETSRTIEHNFLRNAMERRIQSF